MTRVVVTGIGLVTPLGVGLRHTWQNLVAGKSGLVSTKGFADYDSAGWSKVPSKVVGQVPRGSVKDGKWDVLDHLDPGEARRLALFSQYALVATQEAVDDAKLDFTGTDSIDKTTVGVAVGSGIGSFADVYDNSVAFDSAGYKRVQPLFIPKLLNNMAAGNISIKHGLKGPLHSVSTACATGLNAIGDAYNFLQNDYANVMICGGTEASLHPLALAGFSRARSVVTDFEDDPIAASRPFDAARSGFVLSEGCGILVLEKLDHALARGVTQFYGEVTGYGLCGDAHHITAPEESGEGAFRAMQMAVKRAKVDPHEIGYVNAHATSTVIGDRAENNAINRLFAGHQDLSVSSTKSSIGHLLGAAGAVEAAFTLKALQTGNIPATLNLTGKGGHKGDDATQFSAFDYVPEHSRQKTILHALCNSFGFGGVNSSVVFSKYS
ncbi:putative beta-keto-acyl synthase [Metschnikowia bicuspidata var. bicuspidata NRRL YB-4993]|uniref:3-oxoacyl-[acyl-carrier-protein] synthase n=1 Tax=Metschnikowia bicuspidata var. bicuspidata NRRL YB-4993 TaxID=869754 RepID=A0A1A0HKB4_9ASCO|nr:putative beta-keto-acyl synthase [Metschnikowia bicuspidata var. bicuspidata NRRL YB-4993]OBA24243.1 putative beta-keto-acyl synthase [Metschnikowia bicuspidata var. bicuspidata NRRL YB-4993]